MKLITGAGWQEAVMSVRDIGRWVEVLEHIAGWSVAHRGSADSRLLSAYGLAATSSATEALLFCPEDPSRWVRLLSFAGVEQRQIRSSGQPWETGGLFSLLCYCRDAQSAFERAQDMGWSAHNDPVLMEFGESELLNVVLRGPDGCNFGLYQRLNAEPDQDLAFPKLGPPFTGQQMVRDLSASESFFTDALGWDSWFAGETRLSCNNFGIPANMVGQHPKKIAIMDATERKHGQVELVQWTGFEGRDFAEHAVPPNLGHLALRWPVNDLQPYLDRCKAEQILVPPLQCELAPFGEVGFASVRTPDGIIIDLIAP